MRSRSAGARLGLFGVLLALPHCAAVEHAPSVSSTALQRLSRDECRAVLRDSSDSNALQTAAQQSLEYYRRVPEDRALPLLDATATVRELRSVVESLFAHPLKTGEVAMLCDRFTLVRAQPVTALLIGGYDEPELPARRSRSERFRYPVYGVPPDRIEVDVGWHCSDCVGTTMIGRRRNGDVVPYYTRTEIDAGALNGRAPEIAWLDDPIDAFVLQVQGSALLRFDDGVHLEISYNGSNGRPYTNIARVLVGEGKLPADHASLASLKAYLRAHPADSAALMQRNERYLFFRSVPVGPIGSLGIPLTAGRSIAADRRSYPPGALAFLTFKPTQPGLPTPSSRLVLVQDSSAGLSSANRIEVFWGTGETAGAIAGTMHESGDLYFFLP